MARSLRFFIFLLACSQCHSLVPTINQKGNAAKSLISTSSEKQFLSDQIIEKDDDPLDESVRSRRAFLGTVLSASVVFGMADISYAKEESAISSESLLEASAVSVDWEDILQKSSKKALGGGKGRRSICCTGILAHVATHKYELSV
jgi:hypothetical protein